MQATPAEGTSGVALVGARVVASHTNCFACLCKCNNLKVKKTHLRTHKQPSNSVVSPGLADFCYFRATHNMHGSFYKYTR